MSRADGTNVEGVQMPPTPSFHPLEEQGIGKMSEHAVSATSAQEQEDERISQLAQERLPQKEKSPEQLSERRIVEQKTTLECDADKIQQSQLSQPEPRGSAIIDQQIHQLALEDRIAEEKSHNAESNLFPSISGEETIPGMPPGPFTIEDRMKALNVPGVGVVVIKDGRVVLEKGYGELATVQGKPKVLSQAASMSKTVTALTILSLIEQCRQKSLQGQHSGLAHGINFDLDTNVKDIFTEILGKEKTEALWKMIDPNHLSTEPEHSMTIRHLLSHTAGLGEGAAPYFNQEGLMTQIQQLQQEIQTEEESLKQDSPLQQKLAVLRGMYEKAKQEQLPSTDDLLEGRSKMGAVEIVSQPGTRFEYSNKGIVILQKLVEVLTQKSFAETVNERVLNPLGMTQSTYDSPPLEEVAKGNDEEGLRIPGMWFRTPELAAGGLWTTVTDFKKIVLEIQKALLGESLLVSSELAHEMIVDQVPFPHEESPSHGLGVHLEKLALADGQSVTYFSHGGYSPGFQSYMIGNDRGDGAIIMTNSEIGDILYPEILRSIATAYEWPASNMLKKCQPLLNSGEISPPSPETIEKWAARVQGKYKYWENEEDKHTHTPDHIVEIRFDRRNGKIYADIDGGSAQEGGRTVELVPGGANFAVYLKRPPGLYAICDFSTDEGSGSPEAPLTHHNLFGMNFVRDLS